MTVKEKQIPILKVVRTLLPPTFKAAPFLVTVDCSLMVITSVCSALLTPVMQHLFDSVSGVIDGSVAYKTLIFAVIAACAIQFFKEIMNFVCNYWAEPLGIKVRGEFQKRVNEKAAKLPAVSFEDPETLDIINKASQGASKSVSMYHCMSTLFSWHVPYYLTMAIYLYSLRPLLALCILFIFLPGIVSQVMKGYVFTKFTDEAAPLQRKMEYYERTMYHREFFKETRILGIFDYIKDLHLNVLKLFTKEKWKTTLRAQMVDIVMEIATLIGFYGILILLLDSVIKGFITVGAFAAVFASINRFFGMMRGAVNFFLGTLFLQNIGLLRSYVKFLGLPEKQGQDKDIDFGKGISLRNISFRYPGSNQDSLKNISFDIKPKETIAFVGENGAGKTTLVKLITGILNPTEGDVFIGDISTKDISNDSLFANTSAVFQKFQRYRMSLKENVAISVDTGLDEGKVNDVLAQSDLDVDEKFTDGLDTMLSREFDGIDLSGGQWQRIALARGLYRDSQFIVLDEPTSAIDPIEETKLYHKFASIAKDKTAIIVTHRLGSTKIADRIVVMNDGKIDAIGTHHELMAQEGLYAKMYKSQAKWYEDQ